MSRPTPCWWRRRIVENNNFILVVERLINLSNLVAYMGNLQHSWGNNWIFLSYKWFDIDYIWSGYRRKTWHRFKDFIRIRFVRLLIFLSSNIVSGIVFHFLRYIDIFKVHCVFFTFPSKAISYRLVRNNG